MKIALLQPQIRPGDVFANLAELTSLYKDVEADLAVAPELALGGYGPGVEFAAEEAALADLSDLVTRHHVPLLLGARLFEGERPFNTALLLTPEGRLPVAAKVNLFPGLDDKAGLSPGPPPRPFPLGNWRLGSLLCFDLRFPEIAKKLVLLGAEVLLVLAQWPASRLEHFHALLRARALENQVFVLGVNACGEAYGEPLGGGSVAFDPQGQELATLSQEPGWRVLSIERKRISSARELFVSSRAVPVWCPEEKIVSLSILLSEVEARRRLGQKMVFTNGCFDLLHAGHVDYLFEARGQGDFLVVGLNSDASLRRLKGSTRPLTPQEYRARVLASLYCVDYVVIFEEDTPEHLITALRPDVLVKGADWPEEKIVGAGLVKSYGGKVVRIPFRYNISTSSIIEKIKKNSLVGK